MSGVKGEARDGARPGRRIVRAPQSLVAGIGLILLVLFGVWAASDLPRGTLGAIGPGMMPHWLALSVGVCGLALVVAGFTHDGSPLQAFSLRGPVVVVLAVLAFALTIRPFTLGPVVTPGLGLIVAGPLAVIIGGYASPEARLGELVALALLLTAGCMLLFGDLLNLPIPIFPTVLVEALTGSIPARALLRIVAGVLALVGLIVVFLMRRSARRAAVDVVQPSMPT